jgi:hypothetical protein
MTTRVPVRGFALAVGVLTPAAWLLWAEHLAGGWRTVLATAGLWWLAALQATWPVWLPAGVVAGALWLAIPPQGPRRRRGPGLPVVPAAPSPGAPPEASAAAAAPAVREPAREPTPEPVRGSGPDPVPAPVRTVWEAVDLSVPGAEGDGRAA